MTRILWLSNHVPLASEIEALKVGYGNEVEIIQDHSLIFSADQVIDRYRKKEFEDIVIVAPRSLVTLVEKLINSGIHPIWAEREAVPKSYAEVFLEHKGWRFVRLKRIEKINIELVLERFQPVELNA